MTNKSERINARMPADLMADLRKLLTRKAATKKWKNATLTTAIIAGLRMLIATEARNQRWKSSQALRNQANDQPEPQQTQNSHTEQNGGSS